MFKENRILKLEIIATIFIMISGVLLHFAFEWSNNNILVGTVSPVNESIWEHLKLVFFPMIISTIVVYFLEGKNISNYLCSKTIGIISAISFIVIFFYTYTGILGMNISVIDISSFFIAVILGQYISYKKMKSEDSCNNIIPISIIIILYLYFLIFTFFPPHIGLFKEPITGMFGI